MEDIVNEVISILPQAAARKARSKSTPDERLARLEAKLKRLKARRDAINKSYLCALGKFVERACREDFGFHELVVWAVATYATAVEKRQIESDVVECSGKK